VIDLASRRVQIVGSTPHPDERFMHYHRERNHQGIENALILSTPATSSVGRIRRRPRLGGLLNYYDRAA
jgi:hypothetical protein